MKSDVVLVGLVGGEENKVHVINGNKSVSGADWKIACKFKMSVGDVEYIDSMGLDKNYIPETSFVSAGPEEARNFLHKCVDKMINTMVEARTEKG